MSIVRLSYFKLIVVLILMFMLSIIPLPSMLSLIRPLWVMLFMLFIQVTIPSRFRVGGLLLVGLTLDTLCFSVMGKSSICTGESQSGKAPWRCSVKIPIKRSS